MDLIQQEVSGLLVEAELVVTVARQLPVLVVLVQQLELLMLVQAMELLHREMDLLQEKTPDLVVVVVVVPVLYLFVAATVVPVS
jgi:hypothetical protein